MKSRIQTKLKSNQSIHWTHQYAIKDRVRCDPTLADRTPQLTLNDLPLCNLLPGKTIQNTFKRDSTVLVSRIVAKYLAPFNQFKDIIINHIPHMFSEEMAKKSERV